MLFIRSLFNIAKIIRKGGCSNMIINKESEKHIRNLARCINRINKPFEKLGETFTLFELLNTKGLSQEEKDNINFDIAKEVSQLLIELGIDYKNYTFDRYKNWEG